MNSRELLGASDKWSFKVVLTISLQRLNSLSCFEINLFRDRVFLFYFQKHILAVSKTSLCICSATIFGSDFKLQRSSLNEDKTASLSHFEPDASLKCNFICKFILKHQRTLHITVKVHYISRDFFTCTCSWGSSQISCNTKKSKLFVVI